MLKSVRAKLFLTLAIAVIIFIAFFMVVNNTVIEKYYYFKEYEKSLSIYDYANKEYDKNKLSKMAFENNYEIIIKNEDEIVFSNSVDFSKDFDLNIVKSKIEYSIFNLEDVIYSNGKINVSLEKDNKYDIDFMLLFGKLDSGEEIYLRTSMNSIYNMIKASNRFLGVSSILVIIFGGIIIFFVTEKFTSPIEKLDKIAQNMAKLDFSQKYELLGTNDEIDNLGKNINHLSEELESTIKKMQKINSDLEKDIENKSKIDEMRRQFISDVSHELKTPISLIQGYAEGLVENVVTDEDSKNFYSEVILDEANRMDKLVKRLLELMKLEYEDRNFNDQNFDVVELINEVIRISKVKLEEEKIDVIFEDNEPIYVFADDFYIEQVVTNYFTNAIKNVKPVKGKKQIKISIKKATEQGKVRISIFNTGDKISEENLNRIWNRFYKVDESRDRSKGGTGIGLALVKAIMNKYENKYGVENKSNGVEFYFELSYANISREM